MGPVLAGLILRIVRGFLQLKLQAVKKRKAQSQPTPASEQLRDRSMIHDYNVALTECFGAVSEGDNLEETWLTFQPIVSEVALDVLGGGTLRRGVSNTSHRTLS